MSMNECDNLNSYNALVSANHYETIMTPVKPKSVVNTAKEQVVKSQTAKEAERVATTGYSSSPQINNRLNQSATKPATATSSSSSYSGYSGYSGNSGYSGYSGYSGNTGSQYKGNNLDYNSRIAKLRQKAKETATKQAKYESSRGAGLIDETCTYSFSVKNGKVKHNSNSKNKTSKLLNKKVVKQAVVAVGVIVLEAALGLAMSEAKSSITGISNEIKKSINSKV